MKLLIPWRPLLPLICAFCAAAAAIWLVQQHIEDQLKQRQQPAMTMASAAVVVPARDLASGVSLQPSDLQVRELPVQGLPEDAVMAQQARTVFSSVLAADVKRGRPLQYLHLRPARAGRMSEVLKPGQRAFTLPLGGSSSSGGLVAVGDQVDLYEQRAQTFSPLFKADVIAIGSDWQSVDYREGASSVTLAVPDVAVARLESLNRKNALAFWLRNRSDQSALPPATVNNIEVIIAGQTGGEIW